MYIDVEYIEAMMKQADFVALTTTDGDSADTTLIESIIASAEAEVNNALAQGGYVVPVDPVTEYIKTLVADIFMYRLYARTYDDKEPDAIYARYNLVNSKLNKIANGEIKIADIARKPVTGRHAMSVDVKPRQFTFNERGGCEGC